MNARVEQSTISRTPHAFLDKQDEPILITPLDEARARGLIKMYLAYEPRNSFWSLPPIQDEACRRWVQGMIADGVNLLALSFDAGVVGRKDILAYYHGHPY